VPKAPQNLAVTGNSVGQDEKTQTKFISELNPVEPEVIYEEKPDVAAVPPKKASIDLSQFIHTGEERKVVSISPVDLPKPPVVVVSEQEYKKKQVIAEKWEVTSSYKLPNDIELVNVLFESKKLGKLQIIYALQHGNIAALNTLGIES